MISLEEVKIKSARNNAESNNRLHFFSSKLSIYFSWVFINMGMTANQVTALFFSVGLVGSFMFLSFELTYILIGYVAWRLHVLIDICDGDVARFNKQSSINGSYWDYMIHSLLYPMYFGTISYALFVKFNSIEFLVVGLFGSIIVSQLLSVKNNYYRAMLFSGMKLDLSLGKNKQTGKKFLVKSAIQSVLSFEGFLITYLAASMCGAGSDIFIALLVFYTFIFLLIVVVKFYLFSKQGFYERRS